MATITVLVNSKPFLKTLNALGGRKAGAAIDIIEPIYLDSTTDPTDPVVKVADSDPAVAATSVVIGIAVTKAETDSQCVYAYTTGDVIDFGGTLTVGDNYWLVGSTIDNAYSSIPAADYVVKLGYCNEDGDFVVNIIVQGEVK
jgi:hypothetical protein